MHLAPLRINKLPHPPRSILQLLGPSFVLIGLGLGTGELILWPYLAANFGLGIIWGAALGITLQFFLNMEIERYTLANGESVFVGFARLFKMLPIWFVISTILAWSWPGFSASAAAALKPFGVEQTNLVAIGMLVLAGLILTFGPILYKTVETFQKTLILIGIPLIIFIVAMIVKFTDILTLFKGMGGIGEGYLFIPEMIPLMSFLAAFAYSGAGGNLNLAQSFYIKEKKYGMGKYSGRITSLITGKAEKINLEGTTFKPDRKQVLIFKKWWKLVNIEHALIFWFLGLLTILLMAVLAYSTVYGKTGNAEGLNFLYNQAAAISSQVGSIFGSLLLIIVCLMLFSTQLAVIDGAGRIVSENIALLLKDKLKGNPIPKIYYATIWILLIFGMGVLLLGFGEPRFLIVLGAVLNAFCMFVFSGLLNKLNTRLLPKEIQPSLFRKLVVYATFAFFGIFSLLVIIDKL